MLEPEADGFRNYLRAGEKLPAETATLTPAAAPEVSQHRA